MVEIDRVLRGLFDFGGTQSRFLLPVYSHSERVHERGGLKEIFIARVGAHKDSIAAKNTEGEEGKVYRRS